LKKINILIILQCICLFSCNKNSQQDELRSLFGKKIVLNFEMENESQVNNTRVATINSLVEITMKVKKKNPLIMEIKRSKLINKMIVHADQSKNSETDMLNGILANRANIVSVEILNDKLNYKLKTVRDNKNNALKISKEVKREASSIVDLGLKSLFVSNEWKPYKKIRVGDVVKVKFDDGAVEKRYYTHKVVSTEQDTVNVESAIKIKVNLSKIPQELQFIQPTNDSKVSGKMSFSKKNGMVISRFIKYTTIKGVNTINRNVSHKISY